MRKTIFRILAGVIAVLFAAFLVFGNQAELALHKKIGFWILALGFAFFALFGKNEAVERFWSDWFSPGIGGRNDDQPPK